MATVLLVRHGRTTANSSGVLAGWTPGVELDDKGREQATRLGERLAEVKIDQIVTSPLERCRQTAAAIVAARSGDLPIDVDDRVGECRYGDWTGKALKDLAREPLWKVVQQQPAAAVFPGAEGESLAEMSARAVAAVRDWDRKVGPKATLLIVSHGDVIKAILADALGVHLDGFQRINVDPASLSVVRYTYSRPMVERINDMGGSVAALLVAPKRKRGGHAVVGGGAGH